MADGRIGHIAIIGAGAMGEAFAAGLVKGGVVSKDALTLADLDASKLKTASEGLGVRVTSDNAGAAAAADVILIAVKPAIVPDVLEEISELVTAEKLVISIAAGVKLETIQSNLSREAKAIRAMPNTPCRIGAGAIGFARGKGVGDEQVAIAKCMFETVGLSFEVPERLLDAVTGLSGSGPAYVFVMIEALADAGVRVGLPRETALKLAAQTVMGAARMVIDENEHPARLKDQVTSPGGTTIAGLDALEKAGFRSALIDAVKAATKRAEELG